MDRDEFGKLFAKNLNYFMDLNGKTQSDISIDLKISKATVSSWCLGTRTPRTDKLDMLCDYFHIKRSDLTEDKTKEQEGGYYLNKETREIAQAIYVNPELRILFDASQGLEPSDIEFVLKMVETIKKSKDEE